MRLVVGFVAFALTGCVTEPDIVSEAFITPDGRPGHIVYCGGTASSMAECYDDARKICGGDYTMLNRATSQRLYAGDLSTENRSIEITCSA